jgi:hypothetical protein
MKIIMKKIIKMRNLKTDYINKENKELIKLQNAKIEH